MGHLLGEVVTSLKTILTGYYEGIFNIGYTNPIVSSQHQSQRPNSSLAAISTRVGLKTMREHVIH